jgi:hypothetical protein
MNYSDLSIILGLILVFTAFISVIFNPSKKNEDYQLPFGMESNITIDRSAFSFVGLLMVGLGLQVIGFVI